MSAVASHHGNDTIVAGGGVGVEEDSDDQSWHSRFDLQSQRDSLEEESLSDVDLECGVLEMKVHSGNKMDRDCRICHLGLECGVPIELGCSCKGDLGSAHKQCADTWFKIKGDTLVLLLLLFSFVLYPILMTDFGSLLAFLCD